jgi:hypothetical protein
MKIKKENFQMEGVEMEKKSSEEKIVIIITIVQFFIIFITGLCKYNGQQNEKGTEKANKQKQREKKRVSE